MIILTLLPGTRNRYVSFFLRCIRWSVILACFGFVAWGWIRSGTKYLAKQTSVSSKVNDTDMFTYPSITFCHKFRLWWFDGNLVEMLEHIRDRDGLQNINDFDFEGFIDEQRL